MTDDDTAMDDAVRNALRLRRRVNECAAQLRVAEASGSPQQERVQREFSDDYNRLIGSVSSLTEEQLEQYREGVRKYG